MSPGVGIYSEVEEDNKVNSGMLFEDREIMRMNFIPPSAWMQEDDLRIEFKVRGV